MGGRDGAPRPHKSLNGSGQDTFSRGTRDLCAGGGVVEGEGGRQGEIGTLDGPTYYL